VVAMANQRHSEHQHNTCAAISEQHHCLVSSGGGSSHICPDEVQQAAEQHWGKRWHHCFPPLSGLVHGCQQSATGPPVPQQVLGTSQAVPAPQPSSSTRTPAQPSQPPSCICGSRINRKSASTKPLCHSTSPTRDRSGAAGVARAAGACCGCSWGCCRCSRLPLADGHCCSNRLYGPTCRSC